MVAHPHRTNPPRLHQTVHQTVHQTTEWGARGQCVRLCAHHGLAQGRRGSQVLRNAKVTQLDGAQILPGRSDVGPGRRRARGES